MDFGAASRPAPVATQPFASSEISGPRPSAPLELRPSQTVQSAPAGDAVKLDIRARSDEQAAARDRDAEKSLDGQALDDAEIERNERRTVIDDRTRSVVMEERDRDTGERISQLPDETMLKLRAFARELAARQRAEQAEDAALSRSA